MSLGCIDAWLPYIQLKTSHSSNIAVLDPGSVYWLTKLQGFGSQATGRSLYQRWWEDKFEQWSSALDVVVWLDAPEDLCLQRILARNQWHDAKHMTSKDALSRFRGLRMSYEQIITKMVSKQPKKVFYFRTDQISTEQIVNRLFSEVNFTPRSHAQIDRTDSSTEASDSPTQPRINNSAIHIEY